MKILYPVNKSYKLKINPSIYKNINIDIGVSIITCTNKKNKYQNILKNYNRQIHVKKELIIILNDNSLEINKHKIDKHSNVKIFKLDEKITLGECLNFAIDKSQYPIITKFDDDDYYGPKYLSDSIKTLKYTHADIAGKSSTFIYFEKDKFLVLKNNNRDNRFVSRVEGSTLIFRKEILDNIRFKPKNLGEDLEFCKDAIKKGYKIYSSNIYNYLYIRNANNNHSWNIPNEYLIKYCKVICKGKDIYYILDNYIDVTSHR